LEEPTAGDDKKKPEGTWRDVVGTEELLVQLVGDGVTTAGQRMATDEQAAVQHLLCVPVGTHVQRGAAGGRVIGAVELMREGAAFDLSSSGMERVTVLVEAAVGALEHSLQMARIRKGSKQDRHHLNWLFQ
jgi:hypothetical protein